MLDQIDRRILGILQDDARTSNAEIARQVGMAASAVLERVRKLEERGAIKGYNARLNPDRLDLGLLAYIFVKTSDGCWCDTTSRKISSFDEVLACHSITGEDCYLVKVCARNTKDLNHFLRTRFAPIKSIVSTRTTIVLETSKETLKMPIREVHDDVSE